MAKEKAYSYSYDMSTPEARERQVKNDYDYAKTNKGPITEKFVELDQYYNNQHLTQKQIAELIERKQLNFIPPIIPDPFIQVESGINPFIPDFEFKGRDDDLDSQKAKQRQYVVQFIMDNNNVQPMNDENERRSKKLGNALFKVAFDDTLGDMGDITIGNPGPQNIFPDPSAYCIDDCEFIIYAFRMHRRKARRVFGKVIDEVGNDNNSLDTEIFGRNDYESSYATTSSVGRDIMDDTVQVIEYWFKQPDSGSLTKTIDGEKITYSWKAGDIACCITVNYKEVKYIPKYWRNTNCKLYPFSMYCNIPVDQSFWDKGDIEPIKDLVDAVDREFMTLILNDAFTGNDIVLAEEGSFKDGFEPMNEPGAIWWTKKGAQNTPARLGGLQGQNANVWTTINGIREVIQETTGNFDSAMGKEPVRVTTASGIAQLNERADMRKNIKKSGRLEGYKRLYELCDWTALEFYTTDRVIFLGADSKYADEKEVQQPDGTLKKVKVPRVFTFNSENVRVLNDNDNNPSYYYPKVDCTVSAGDGLLKSKSFTLQFTQELLKIPITPDNYKIILSVLDIADLPNKQDIKDFIEKRFSQLAAMPGSVPVTAPGMTIEDILAQLNPEEQQILSEHPEIIQQFANQIGGVA
jgi:hypothetical protein